MPVSGPLTVICFLQNQRGNGGCNDQLKVGCSAENLQEILALILSKFVSGPLTVICFLQNQHGNGDCNDQLKVGCSAENLQEILALILSKFSNSASCIDFYTLISMQNVSST